MRIFAFANLQFSISCNLEAFEIQNLLPLGLNQVNAIFTIRCTPVTASDNRDRDKKSSVYFFNLSVFFLEK